MLNKPSPLHGLRAREAIEALIAQVAQLHFPNARKLAVTFQPVNRAAIVEQIDAPLRRSYMEARIAELTKQNDAAPAWGGAVGARCEEIRALQASLSALNQKEGV